VRIVGIRRSPGHGTEVADLADGHVTVIAPLEEFWADADGFLGREPAGPTVPVADVELVPPVLPGARVLCIGLNYLKHVAEGSFAGQTLPEHPTLFARWTQSLTDDGAPVPVPADEDGIDWEGEVVAWVGSTLVDATPDEALAAVVGYSTFNDLTSRRAQTLTSQWILGKTVQDGSTDEMVYTVGDTLSLVSRTLTLRPGDLLATGTPSGVGYARTPPWLLQPGDVVEVEVERLGVLRNPVVGNEARQRAPR
jgi:2-keto-4-pentenoate hydratase/2-oxohepta-3-ene-1,7-dioic acid hydratase in catechol pathway